MGDPIEPKASEPQAPSPVEMTPEQLADFAWLLAHCLGVGNIRYLAYQILGPGGVDGAWNQTSDVQLLASETVKAIFAAGRIVDAVGLLRQDARRHSRFTLGLNHIMNRRRLNSDQTLQAFINEYEPFIFSTAIEDVLPRILRTVCAVALRMPANSDRKSGVYGSGFLIGPDLVMTNAHVLDGFLDFPGGVATPTGSGEDIYCFFDYLWEPTPNVPPELNSRHTSIPVQAAKSWLVHARDKLENDGGLNAPAEVNGHLDYAVIQLRKRIGDLPSRRSGGAARGWLKLPDEIDVTQRDQRVMVFQHPQTAPQQWDMGNFEETDLSGTRVRYSVSAAHGSSGGAAVDKEGKLFALHNAEVETAKGVPHPKKLNQGVRIDYIARDLKSVCPDLLKEDLPEPEEGLYWSLNEDILHPRPIIGRSGFRRQVVTMTRSAGTQNPVRVITVTGPAASGLQFSAKLLRRTVGAHVPIVEFSPTDLQTLKPKAFLAQLLDDLQISEDGGERMPDPKPTEMPSAWTRVDLPCWLAGRLEADAKKDPGRYPAWVIVNTALWTADHKAQRLGWTELKELVAALVGVRDLGQTAVDIPQLRWLFLAPSADVLPLRNILYWPDDLAAADPAAGYAECLESAWRAVDRKSQGENLKMLTVVGRGMIMTAYQPNPQESVLQFLARNVSVSVEEALKVVEQ